MWLLQYLKKNFSHIFDICSLTKLPITFTQYDPELKKNY